MVTSAAVLSPVSASAEYLPHTTRPPNPVRFVAPPLHLLALGLLAAAFGSAVLVAVPVAAQPFAEVTTGVTPLITGALVAGDLDGDGDPDLIVAGGDAQNDPATHLYRNDGGTATGGSPAWVFARITSPFAPVSEPSLDLGDVDGDGDLDVLISGAGVTHLYRNDGGFAFTRLAIGLPSLRRAGGIVEVVNTPASKLGDIDGDGDLDIVLMGEASGGAYGCVWLNDGGGSFTESTVLPALASPSLDLGDYDGDGDLDILALDRPSPGQARALVLENRQSGRQFREVTTSILPVTLGSARFGEAGNDGRLDILVAGTDLSTGTPTESSRLYAGASSGFTQQRVLPPSYFADWIDFDNDGRMDIVQDGSQGGSTFLRFLRNTGDGFTETGTREGVWWGATERADVDGDGLSDLLVMGEVRRAGQSAERRFFFLRSTAPSNAPPSAPQITSTLAFSGTDGESIVQISWDAASDDVSPTGVLTYTVRVGTTPGADDVVTAGVRHLARRGNAGFRRSLTLAGVPSGYTYYASVQAVDQQYAKSAFSEVAEISTGQAVADETAPYAPRAALAPAFPNPFTGSTTLTFTLAEPQHVRLGVFDVLGRRVATLAEGRLRAGEHTAEWRAEALPPGLYMARLMTPSGAFMQRLTLLR